MPGIQVVASEILAWAKAKGFYTSPADTRTPLGARAEGEPSVPELEPAASVIGKRGITMLSLNEPNRQIYIHTLGRLTKKEKAAVPRSVGGFELIFSQSKPLAVGQGTMPAPISPEPFHLHQDRYTCGSSISVANYRSAGTMGCLIRRDGNMYGLTCNHVTGGCNNTKIETPILAPGVMDIHYQTTLAPFTIGRHASVLPMSQGDPQIVDPASNFDAATFTILNPDKVSSMQGNHFDTPIMVGTPTPNMPVKKVGRSTNLSTGMVQSKVFGTVAVKCTARAYPSSDDDESVPFHGIVHFKDLYLIHGNPGPFSQPGDSGSLVVHDGVGGSSVAVGILFAGEGNETYILPIKPILEALGASLVHGHNI